MVGFGSGALRGFYVRIWGCGTGINMPKISPRNGDPFCDCILKQSSTTGSIHTFHHSLPAVGPGRRREVVRRPDIVDTTFGGLFSATDTVKRSFKGRDTCTHVLRDARLRINAEAFMTI
jgi:hypothetical protein